MRSNPKLIIVLGPTSSGKSAYGIELAKKIHGEVISADSRQVYKGFDLTSGKVTRKEMRGVPHHLLDVASPRRTYSVATYRREAQKAIKKILERGKTPIIVGGAGFYIDSILYDQTMPDVKPDLKLRKELEGRPAESLFAELQKKDPVRAESIDKHNKRRLIRALEIIESTGRPVPEAIPKKLSSFLTDLGIKEKDILKIGLNPPKEELQKRIHDRILLRLRRGMVAEIKKLHSGGLTWKRLEELGLEYKWISHYLRGKVRKEEMITGLTQDTWQYARRQLTWWRKDSSIKWI